MREARFNAARTSDELRLLGLGKQRLAINGVFHASQPNDAAANAIEALGREAMAHLPDALAASPRDEVPLRAFNTVGLPALRALFSIAENPIQTSAGAQKSFEFSAATLAQLTDELATAGRGLIMVMGKGGVGKTTIAAALAVFHAFSRVVNEARSAFVVLDTAPTGHSLLLMDATGAYHRQMTQQYEGMANAKHIVTPLMRLQDPDTTKVLLVTLPETAPVTQAAALQDDLRRAHIEPWAWVVNKSLAATGTVDPLLQARLVGEQQQTERTAQGLAQRTCALPRLAEAPVRVAALGALTQV